MSGQSSSWVKVPAMHEFTHQIIITRHGEIILDDDPFKFPITNIEVVISILFPCQDL